jgi:integrase/recombinase XerD
MLYLVSGPMNHWDQVLMAYEVHQKASNRAVRTIEGRRLLLKSLARTTGKNPHQITELDLLARLGRGIAPSSMQRERSDFQSFFGWAKQNGYVKKNPAKNLPKITVPRTKPRPLTVTQVEAMLTSGAYRRTRIMIILGLYQGLRAHEIAKLQGSDIDLSSGTLNVIGKGRKEAILPLHPVVAAIATTMPAGYWFPSRSTNTTGHIHYRSVSDLMSRAIRRAGITDRRLTGHSLRHTFGSELVEAGIDIRVVKELMRHESLNSTQIYTLVSERKMREGQDALPIVHLPDRSGRLAA